MKKKLELFVYEAKLIPWNQNAFVIDGEFGLEDIACVAGNDLLDEYSTEDLIAVLESRGYKVEEE